MLRVSQEISDLPVHKYTRIYWIEVIERMNFSAEDLQRATAIRATFKFTRQSTRLKQLDKPQQQFFRHGFRKNESY